MTMRTTFSLIVIMLTCWSWSRASASEPQHAARQLTDDGFLKRDPCFRPDGSSLVFASRHRAPRMVLLELNLASGKVTRLHPQSNLVELSPSFTRDGSLLCFQRMTGNDQTAFVLEQVQQKSARQMTGSGKVSWNVQVGPEGQWVVYNLSGQLFRKSLLTDEEQQLTESAGRNDWPSISPNGKQVAFASSRNGDYDLYRMNMDGSQLQRLTEAQGLDMRPRWSPDGMWILSTSNRHGNYEIYVTRTDGTESLRLTEHDEKDDFACWHPDGKQIVWVRENQGRYDLYQMPIPTIDP